ncbi:MAG: hypothetical protein S4CHLAM102_11480 [Chlamydiia bacterium]|nr:hypothetical protein [Chlamydiia bacterium]
MRLILIQHGLADEDVLSETGKQQARRAARILKRLDEEPSIFIASTKQRAVATRDIISDSFEADFSVKVSLDAFKATAPTDEGLAYIGELDPGGSVVICGHVPYLNKLISFFLTGKEEAVVEVSNGDVTILEVEELKAKHGKLIAMIPNQMGAKS